jgi:DNA-binding transcriptional regulator WhiA
VRTSRAAHAQLEAIRRLDLARLPAPLREVAELRVRRPALSLREVSLRCDPVASKASVHRRLQRLVRLAGG